MKEAIKFRIVGEDFIDDVVSLNSVIMFGELPLTFDDIFIVYE